MWVESTNVDNHSISSRVDCDQTKHFTQLQKYTYKYLQNLTKYPKFVQILISNGKIQFVDYESQVRHDHVAAILLRMFIVCLLTLSITLSIIFIIIS